MNVDTAGVVLFVHIAVALVAFSMAGVLHTALLVVGRASDVREIRTWGAVVHRIEPLLPLMALVLLGLGSWLVHLGHDSEGFSFSTGWILTSIITLVLVEAAGGVILAPRGKKLTHLIEASADGPLPAELRAASRDPLFWDFAHLTTFAFFGIVFLMAAKPSGGWAPVFPIVGAIVGVVLSRWEQSTLPAYNAPTGVVPQQGQAAETADA